LSRQASQQKRSESLSERFVLAIRAMSQPAQLRRFGEALARVFAY